MILVPSVLTSCARTSYSFAHERFGTFTNYSGFGDEPMKRVIVWALVAVSAFAGKKPAPPLPPPPTEAQMREAYAVAVKQLTAMAKNPTTLRLDPIEKAWFKLRGGTPVGLMNMMLVFDGQNSFGAMIRSTAFCDVFADKAFCSTENQDFIALGPSPAKSGYIQIPEPLRLVP